MNGNTWVRPIHRWTSIVFVMTVVACFIVLALEAPPAWVFYVPLPPLALLMFTGLYLFALPYATKWRARRRDARAA